MGMWFWRVDRACRESQIPLTQRSEAAILLVYDEIPLGEIMKERQRVYCEKSGKSFWPWPEFKEDLVSVVRAANKSTYSRSVVTACCYSSQPVEGWNWKKAAGIALVVGGVSVLLFVGGVLLLNLAGWTAVGVTKGQLRSANPHALAES